jgi:hypothetical protein
MRSFLTRAHYRINGIQGQLHGPTVFFRKHVQLSIGIGRDVVQQLDVLLNDLKFLCHISPQFDSADSTKSTMVYSSIPLLLFLSLNALGAPVGNADVCKSSCRVNQARP